MAWFGIAYLYLVCYVIAAATTDSCDVKKSTVVLLINEAHRNQSTETENLSEDDSQWGPCSASCGEGVQKRVRGRPQIRRCFIKFCPGYLSLPRIHFFGTFTADVSTVNNARCNYVTKRFSTAALKEGLSYTSRKDDDVAVETNNWNPDGSGRFRLHAKVTSLCTSESDCSVDDDIIGREVKETSVVAMVDIDPDWQLASEIYGMTLRIDGVLQGRFVTSAIQSPKRRGNNVYSALKSRLVDVTWSDERLRKMFNDVTELSIMTTMDQFLEKTREGRITGTIGLTSNDDPLSTSATRRLLPTTTWTMKGSAPFYIHERSLTIDLSLVFNCSSHTGFFNVSALGDLDLAVYVTDDVGNRTSKLQYITNGGGLSKQMSWNWYSTFGGIVDIKHLSNDSMRMMASHRVVMTQKRSTEESARVILAEPLHGINLGFMESHVHRLNPGEAFHLTAFASSFGRPLDGGEVSIEKVGESFADLECGWSICNGALGIPTEALVTSKSSLVSGFAELKVYAAKDPGNVRGCELDGQIYPIALRLRFKNSVFVDGGFQRQSLNSTIDHDFYLAVVPAVVAVYSEVREKSCPTWGDVKDIFLRYHNLYPVMWKHNIIDMTSYDDVRKRSRMLKYAMFEVDFDDPRYMPISRDLSKSKANLIRNWIDCGMQKESEFPTCRNADSYLSEARLLLQRAVTLELTIIPPYFTAWLSLQTELGRNKDVANILKSVFVDEMLHMSLAGNMLNAINGKVNLTSYSHLPYYPTSLIFGDGYKLLPNSVLTLGRMSRGAVSDIFMAVEQPVDDEQRKVLGKVAQLLETLKAEGSSSAFFMNGLKPYHDSANDETNATQLDWREINRFSARGIYDLSLTKIESIGAFYAMIALQLAFVESCVRTERGASIFIGDVSRQLNMSHWHRPEDFSKTDQPVSDLPVFAVTDLTSALQAIVAIIYEGEGGANCTPFLEEDQLPHYFRFMEILHGRKLRKVFEASSKELSACPNLGSHCHVTQSTTRGRYCFAGEVVPFHDDGVWSIITNPDETMYPDGSEVKKWNKEFNIVYTKVLRCLERSFSGKPDHVKQCMQEMHNMKIVGKKVVQSPVIRNGVTIGYGTPTWVYQRDRNEWMGIPRILPNDELY